VEGERDSLAGLNWQLSVAKTDELWPNPWNPNKQSDFIYEKEKNSISKFGFIEPVQVRDFIATQSPWAGRKYQIINGEHRWKAVIDLKIDAIPIINLGIVPDSIAKQLTLILNETHGDPNPIKLAQLVQDLTKDIDFDELQQNLPFTPEAIEGLLKTFEAPEYDSHEMQPKDQQISLQFDLSRKDAKFISQVLDRINDDRSKALIYMCKQANKAFRKGRGK
jgi:hypothetical protein